MPPMLAVHLRINDASTGNPTAVRLCVSASDGTCFAPLGLRLISQPGATRTLAGISKSAPSAGSTSTALAKSRCQPASHCG